MEIPDKIKLLKWVPVVCFAIGLCAIGAALKVYERVFNDRNLRKPVTGKTKGL